MTSVHPGAPLGTRAEIQAVVTTQKGLIPNLGKPTFACVDIADTPGSGSAPRDAGQVWSWPGIAL